MQPVITGCNYTVITASGFQLLVIPPVATQGENALRWPDKLHEGVRRLCPSPVPRPYRARKEEGRLGMIVGRVGALKSCPYANLRAGLAEIPRPLGGKTHTLQSLAGWPACGPKKELASRLPSASEAP